MADTKFFVKNSEEAGLNRERVSALFERVRRDVDQGLLPSAQVAIARNGRIGAMASFGYAVQGGGDKPATNETLYAIFSCTKAIVSSAAWLLIERGKLDPARRVAEIVPEFGANGKDKVTVEQVFLHTGGFPNAPFPQYEWLDRRKRLDRFSSWRLEFEPGTRYEYHPTSGFWVIGEIIDRLAGHDFREFISGEIAQPLDLPQLRVGLASEFHDRVADVVYVGNALTPDELREMGLPDIPEGEVNEETILGFNSRGVRESGVPGGGGFMTAADLALFYQALLASGQSPDRVQVWQPETLREALRVRSGSHFDPYFGFKSNRALGVVIAGDDGKANFRGFGRTNSPLAFGHGGAGGQIGWGDPATGISLGYCTNGFDRNFVRQGRRGVAISSIAATCAA